MIDPSFCLQLLDHLMSGGETHESSSLSVEGSLFIRDVLRSGATANEHGAALVHSNQKRKVV
jgi:hypothetical protein